MSEQPPISPTPWTWNSDNGCIFDARGLVIASMGDNTQTSVAEDDANATLMASGYRVPALEATVAALTAALKEMVEHVQTGVFDPQNSYENDILVRAEAAIRAAKEAR